MLLPPATKLGQGNIFKSVCQEFCPGGAGCLGRHPPGSRHPPRSRPTGKQTPPGAVHAARYGQQAGGTHPTGMHTCFHLQSWTVLWNASYLPPATQTLPNEFRSKRTYFCNYFVASDMFHIECQRLHFQVFSKYLHHCLVVSFTVNRINKIGEKALK